MIFVSSNGDAARSLSVSTGVAWRWLSYLPTAVEPRSVDVGHVCLSTVVCCSRAEAMIATDRVLGEHADPVFTEIAELLAWSGAPEYYTSWVIVETADID